MPTPEEIAWTNNRIQLQRDIAAHRPADMALRELSQQAAPADATLQEFSQAAQTGRLSPPVRQTGQMYAPNGVRVGTVYNRPVNESAQAVVGGYSPYGTVLYAPPRRNRFLEMQAMFNAFRPDPAMMQQIFMQALRQPIRVGAPRGGASTSAKAAKTAPTEITVRPVNYKPDPRLPGGPTTPAPRRVLPGRFSTFDNYGLSKELLAGIGGGGGGGGGVHAEVPTEKRAITDPADATTRNTVRGGQLTQVPIEAPAPSWWKRMLQWNLFPPQNLYEPNRKNGMPSTIR